MNVQQSSSRKNISPWWLLVGTLVILGAVFFSRRIHFSNTLQSVSPTPPLAMTETDKLIAKTEVLVAQHPQTTKEYLILASYYLQKVRETADATYYAKAEDLAQKAEKIDSNDPEVFAIRSSIAAGRHDFIHALDFAKKAVASNPDRAAYFGLQGDAQIELGQYDDAVKSIQHMVDLRPDFSSYTRVAYLREIYGDIPGAIAMLRLAESAGSLFPENRAWLDVEFGKLYMRSNLQTASQFFDHAIVEVPNFAPALKWQGMVLAYQGDMNGARNKFQKALQQLPIAEYAIDTGDIDTLMGEKDKAAAQYFIARSAYDKSFASGVNTDQEIASFLASHDMDLDLALQKAQHAYQDRPSITSADVLAWVWYKKRDFAQAKKYSMEALRLGEHDPFILFHAGMIAKANNEEAQSKKYLESAVAIHPRFSLLYAPPHL